MTLKLKELLSVATMRDRQYHMLQNYTNWCKLYNLYLVAPTYFIYIYTFGVVPCYMFTTTMQGT